jgi:quinol monooxygenase YgiN
MKESELMIIVRITMTVLLEKQKEVMQTLLSMLEPDGKEKGSLGHDLFCDMRDNQVFSLIEEWETREDMENHMQSDRFSALLGTKSLLAKPSDIRIHTVSHSEGMEAVKLAREKGLS